MSNIKLFESLPIEKQNRILDAASEVFSKYGYHQAPTDFISQSAGISKGSLFYYFTSKKQLFLYLLDYAITEMMANIDVQPQKDHLEVFDYVTYVTQQKLAFFQKRPYLVEFIMKAYSEDASLLQESKQMPILARYEKESSAILQQVDFSTLSEDISPSDLMTWLSMISFGYMRLYLYREPGADSTYLNDQLLKLFAKMKEKFKRG
ncbi:MAG TPA: TetR/AcrR family transcriptional regulator [Bacilli bacterium]|nr:TetR/AcrR family transcriptional regulator [Bacilli bacterium]